MERVGITDYGVDIVFGGPLTGEEAAELLAELHRKLPPPGGHFGLLVDSRRSRAYSAAEQAIFKRGILLCVERGMERSVVVHDSHIASLQAKPSSRSSSRKSTGGCGRGPARPRRRSDALLFERGRWSGREDLNLRPHGPEPCALPS